MSTTTQTPIDTDTANITGLPDHARFIRDAVLACGVARVKEVVTAN